jgi:hypothetical protein
MAAKQVNVHEPKGIESSSKQHRSARWRRREQLASKKQLRSSCRRRWRLWRTTASLTILLRLEREKFHGHARQCLKPRMILVSCYFFVTNRDLFNLPVQVGGVVDPVSDGPGSSDDYQPPAGQDDDHDEELDPSEDDSNPAPKPVKAQKKVKGSRRLEVENVIQAKRAVLAGAVSTGNSKRKTAPTTEQAAFSSLLPDTSLTPYKVRQVHRKNPEPPPSAAFATNSSAEEHPVSQMPLSGPSQPARPCPSIEKTPSATPTAYLQPAITTTPARALGVYHRRKTMARSRNGPVL